jgi:ABC-type xylose transport system permease subunit
LGRRGTRRRSPSARPGWRVGTVDAGFLTELLAEDGMSAKTRNAATLVFKEYAIVLGIALAFIVFTMVNSRFASLYNILTVLQHASLLCIISIGLTFVMILDEFDLSIATLCSAGVCLSVNLVQTSLQGSSRCWPPSAWVSWSGSSTDCWWPR